MDVVHSLAKISLKQLIGYVLISLLDYLRSINLFAECFCFFRVI